MTIEATNHAVSLKDYERLSISNGGDLLAQLLVILSPPIELKYAIVLNSCSWLFSVFRPAFLIGLLGSLSVDEVFSSPGTVRLKFSSFHIFKDLQQ